MARSPHLNPRFGAAVTEFGTALLKTGSINHHGNRGSAREEELRRFFTERLPARFAVTEGEIVDTMGAVGPQLDLMFYDQGVDFALNAGASSILPAEAVLSTVEVKSVLSQQEISKSIVAAQKLRALQPFGRPLVGLDFAKAFPKSARYYHCLFAYQSDLTEDDWIEKEYHRFAQSCGDAHIFDAVYVLGRGFLNIAHKRGRLEDAEGGAITAFYFSILNFIQREAKRRKMTPYEMYVSPAAKGWVKFSD